MTRTRCTVCALLVVLALPAVSHADDTRQSSVSVGMGVDVMFVTGDPVANASAAPWGGALDLSLRLEPLAPLGDDPCGSEWRFVVGPRLWLADVGLASTGTLGVVFGLRSTNPSGGLPEFAILGTAGAAITEDRSSRGLGLLFGFDVSAGVSVGWRLGATTRLTIDAGLGGVVAWHREVFVVGPIGLSYGASW